MSRPAGMLDDDALDLDALWLPFTHNRLYKKALELGATDEGAPGDNPAPIPWPPGRNEPCWCGSGRKYKKCCGAPSSADTQ